MEELIGDWLEKYKAVIQVSNVIKRATVLKINPGIIAKFLSMSYAAMRHECLRALDLKKKVKDMLEYKHKALYEELEDVQDIRAIGTACWYFISEHMNAGYDEDIRLDFTVTTKYEFITDILREYFAKFITHDYADAVTIRCNDFDSYDRYPYGLLTLVYEYINMGEVVWEGLIGNNDEDLAKLDDTEDTANEK